MRVHHLSVATMCPLAAPLVNEHRRLVCHALLVELADGLALVETGLGTDDCARPSRLGWTRFVTGFDLDPAGTATARIEALGFSPDDVRHVVLTHLDLDHAGGLADFPDARVHVHAADLEAARSARGLLHSLRYVPEQWAHGPDWATYREGGSAWFGFDAVRPLQGLPPEILLVPLPGHSPGHCGVAVQCGDTWKLHCGDAYFQASELDPRGRRVSLGLSLFERFAEVDHAQRMANLHRLRDLHRSDEPVELFCAHDPGELERYTAPGRAASGPTLCEK